MSKTNQINLFVCQSVYQLLNALNLRINVYGADLADIVITDVYPNHEKVAERLRSSGLFNTVYAVRSKFIYDQHYDHSRLKVNLYRAFPTFLLRKAGAVPGKRYDRYITSTFDDFISYLYIVLRKKNNRITHYRYEDGGMSYVHDHASVNKVEKRMQRLLGIVPLGSIKAPMYLYEPELYSVNDGREIIVMPKLSNKDTRFLQTVNSIFGITKDNELKEKAVFFEASYYADNQTNNEAELIRRCRASVGKEFAIKLHPRNGINRFADEDISVMTTDIPWELYCLNHDVKDKILIAVTSNAAISPQLFLEEPPCTVLVYKLFNGQDSLLCIDNYSEYLKKLSAKCSRLYAPADFEELDAVLKETVNGLKQREQISND